VSDGHAAAAGRSTPALLSRAADLHAIEQVLRRYGRAIDRLDQELLAGCFFSDAVLNYPGYSPDLGDYVPWLIEFARSRFNGMMHYLVNINIELSGDVAWTESYLYARHWRLEGYAVDSAGTYSGCSRYVDRVQRRAGEWRIASRTVVREIRLENSNGPFAPFPVEPPRTRDRSDTSYAGLNR
jgi:hypothetical protein